MADSAAVDAALVAADPAVLPVVAVAMDLAAADFLHVLRILPLLLLAAADFLVVDMALAAADFLLPVVAVMDLVMVVDTARVAVVTDLAMAGGHGPRPPQCHDEQVCNNVPVTRYRTVTRYRDEPRTRTVTRYRTETRCCVTKYHDVFDHQWITQVAIVFPQGTELANVEQETFRIALAGSEGASDASLTTLTSVFGYQIANKQVSGNQVTFTLVQIPRYRSGDLLQSSLQNINVNAVSGGVVFAFQDNAALYPRVNSNYQVTVAEAATHQQVASSEPIAGQRQVNASLAFPWDATKLYEVTIHVHREGSVIDSGVVDFQVTQVVSLAVDQGALNDDNKIANVKIIGSSSQALLSFTDLTLPYAGVVTDYTITLVRNGASLGAKSYSRAALQAAADGSVTLSLLDFGMSAANLNVIQPGVSMKVVVEVRRAQTKFAKIQFWKDSAIVVQ